MNKVVLITGASAGMGKETVKLLLKAGYIVYGAARRTDKMADIKALGARLLTMDVTSEESMVQGVSSMIKAEGRIDILINNAGFGAYGAVEAVPLADARYQLEVNLFGAARLTQLVLPYMRQQQYGKIVNVSSIGGKFASALGGWYHASKFAMEALSDSLRAEVKPFGIDVIVIEPGGVKSEWSDIAADHMAKVSRNSVYQAMGDKFAGLVKSQGHRAAEPIVIAEIIKKAI
ncbi:MAG TPA: oxidoreductase [Pedobacter sp.]